MEFGKKIREYRKAKGLTQRELAKLVGIDFTYLSKIETGDMLPPGDEVIARLAQQLDVKEDELFLLAKKIPSQYRREILHHDAMPDILRMATTYPEFRKELEAFVKKWKAKRQTSNQVKETA
jgi:transcriptional regulator with XRE-family HTH domain